MSLENCLDDRSILFTGSRGGKSNDVGMVRCISGGSNNPIWTMAESFNQDSVHFDVSGVLSPSPRSILRPTAARLADFADNFAVAGLVARLADRVALVAVAGFVNVLPAFHRHLLADRVVDGLAAGVFLLFPDGFFDRFVAGFTTSIRRLRCLRSWERALHLIRGACRSNQMMA